MEEPIPGDGEVEKVERTRYNYGIIVHSDVPEEAKQKEIVSSKHVLYY